MAVQHKDYYQVLGVAKGATQDEIRKAFRKLAREHHPDVAKDKKAAEAKFREINEAYEILGDPQKRKKHDEFGTQWRGNGSQGGPAWDSQGGGSWGPQGAGPWGPQQGAGGYEDIDEILQNFMNPQRRPGAQRKAGAGRQARAQNVETEVQVTIEELLSGARKRVNVRLPGGTASELIEVQVPPGMVVGNKVRLRGKGVQGGDLHFKVVLLPHAALKVEGSDLLRTVSVPAWTAALGGTLEVRTPDGTVRLKVPAGTQSGRRFRLPGRGLPTVEKARGDFFVEVQIVVPETMTLEERALWVKLQEQDEARSSK